mmetsp:Transcript_17658/g.36916  ORF Transcript_17658/g.36916 Transcript_17658/m.36916 type:complete len:90 (-) Transcript_17658:31-300(-)
MHPNAMAPSETWALMPRVVWCHHPSNAGFGRPTQAPPPQELPCRWLSWTPDSLKRCAEKNEQDASHKVLQHQARSPRRYRFLMALGCRS